MPNKLCFCCLLLFNILAFAACAAEMGRQTESLLQRDHQVMDDQQLQGYYRRLGDQLMRETRARREGGLLSRSGEERRLEGLRHRWNEVRLELDRRGLRQDENGSLEPQ